LPVQFSVSTIADKTCKFARCGQTDQKICKDVSFEVKKGIEEKCRAEGLHVISAFDDRGCSVLQCASQQACQRDVPKEAYGICKREGGELIVKKDGPNGCVSFVECIHRGDENEIYVEEITDVPDSTELLTIALKLEELKVALDKLAKQSDQIADYYKSTGSSDEERFRRVADLFEAAESKADEIRIDLRGKLNDITIDDLLQIKHDIKYIKDVMIKDIVYLMLSTGDEIREVKSKEQTDCGQNERCFDKAFRVCKPITFYPEGRRSGPKVNLVGLDGDSCVMKAILPEEQGPPAGFIQGINPPYEMTCKIKNYALGVRNPETDIFPYCTGNMIELIKQFGAGPPPSQRGFERQGQFQRGPGQFESEFQEQGQFDRSRFQQQGQFQQGGQFREGGQQFGQEQFGPPPGGFQQEQFGPPPGGFQQQQQFGGQQGFNQPQQPGF